MPRFRAGGARVRSSRGSWGGSRSQYGGRASFGVSRGVMGNRASHRATRRPTNYRKPRLHYHRVTPVTRRRHIMNICRICGKPTPDPFGYRMSRVCEVCRANKTPDELRRMTNPLIPLSLFCYLIFAIVAIAVI